MLVMLRCKKFVPHVSTGACTRRLLKNRSCIPHLSQQEQCNDLNLMQTTPHIKTANKVVNNLFWLKPKCQTVVGFFLQLQPILILGTRELLSTLSLWTHQILSTWKMPRCLTVVDFCLWTQLTMDSWMIATYLVVIQVIILIMIQIQHGVRSKNYYNLLRLQQITNMIICTMVFWFNRYHNRWWWSGWSCTCFPWLHWISHSLFWV